jgi:tetratricopeptide (TPR) repeat protein
METGNFLSTIALRLGLSGRSKPRCPGEEEILAYLGAALDDPSHARIESHLSECEDCRELLVAVARYNAPTEPISDEAAANQVRLIKSYVEKSAARQPVIPAPLVEPRRRFAVGYPAMAAAAAAVVVVAVALSLFVIPNNDSRAQESNSILREAVAEGRRVSGWISGISDHSPHQVTRGAQDKASLNLGRALNRVSDAETPDGRPSERIALAEALISSGNHAEMTRASAILERLSRDGSLKPEKLAEVHNDAGVARLELRDYDAALKSFDSALSYRPEMHQALFNRAVALQMANRDSESRAAWEHFLGTSADAKWKAEAQERMNRLTP